MPTKAQHIEAAQGYLYLEMPEDALDELSHIKSAQRHSKLVIDLQLASEMMAEKWNDAAQSALKLCKLASHEPRYFIHAAFCLHETGDTQKAKQVLLSGPKELMEDPLFHYNMACYLSVLKELKPAKSYLRKAFELDPELKQLARTDEDLKNLIFE